MEELSDIFRLFLNIELTTKMTETQSISYINVVLFWAQSLQMQ